MEKSSKEKISGLITDKTPIEKGDSNTEFATPEAISYQIYLRTLGDKDGYNLEYCRKKATMISEIMWSYQRKSRAEAVEALATSQVQEMIRAGVIPSEILKTLPPQNPEE